MHCYVQCFPGVVLNSMVMDIDNIALFGNHEQSCNLGWKIIDDWNMASKVRFYEVLLLLNVFFPVEILTFVVEIDKCSEFAIDLVVVQFMFVVHMIIC